MWQMFPVSELPWYKALKGKKDSETLQGFNTPWATHIIFLSFSKYVILGCTLGFSLKETLKKDKHFCKIFIVVFESVDYQYFIILKFLLKYWLHSVAIYIFHIFNMDNEMSLWKSCVQVNVKINRLIGCQSKLIHSSEYLYCSQRFNGDQDVLLTSSDITLKEWPFWLFQFAYLFSLKELKELPGLALSGICLVPVMELADKSV